MRSGKRLNGGCLCVVIFLIAVVILGIVLGIKLLVKTAGDNKLQQKMEGVLELTGEQNTGSEAICYDEDYSQYDTYYLPKNLVAGSAEDVRYIVYYSRGEEHRGNYGSVTGAAGITETVNIRIHDLKTGEDIADTTFRGTEPPQTGTATSGKIYGDPPDREKITAWVENTIDD